MPHRRLSVTVLGSGGPVATADRVSSGYLLSIDGKPRILLGAGGGTFGRIGRSRLDISSLVSEILGRTNGRTGGVYYKLASEASRSSRSWGSKVAVPTDGHFVLVRQSALRRGTLPQELRSPRVEQEIRAACISVLLRVTIRYYHQKSLERRFQFNPLAMFSAESAVTISPPLPFACSAIRLRHMF